MRYLIEPEFRAAKPLRAAKPPRVYSSTLRQELALRNLQWAAGHNFSHERMLGSTPAILYREDEQGRHGNFLAPSYEQIQKNRAWSRRLVKVHTSAKRALLSRDAGRCELDSSNSSDALLMNIFCHPETLESQDVATMLGVDAGMEPIFGYKPRVPFRNGRSDCTEVDLKLGNLLIEAKLTEYDFQTAPRRLVERYRDLEDVFVIEDLELDSERVYSYQLIRGVLAAHGSDSSRFCVLCDRRRPDLIEAWHRVTRAVRICNLRCRLQLLTWQELAKILPNECQKFLQIKFGIVG
jgi:hypothetical protein